MFKPILILVYSWLIINFSFAQISIHHEQSGFYSQYRNLSEQQLDSIAGRNVKSIISNLAYRQAGVKSKIACTLQYQVYGWNPYWVGTAYNNYDFSLLSTFCYFSYELNPNTGSYYDIHSWKTTASVTLAQAAGCRVDLCVTNFGSTDNTTFLTNTTAQQTFIDTIIALLQYRNANGVNIDFEGVPGAQRNNLTAFMINLSNQLKAAINGAYVSIALPSVDWSNAFDVAAMNTYVDQFIIMGYGYYYSGSSTAGPTALFYSDGSPWTSYNVVRSVNYFLGAGVTPSKLLLGLPYYGYEWQTTDNSVPGSVVSAVSSRTYAYERNNYRGVYPMYFDQQSFNPYYAFNTGNWYQCWIDNEYSLGKKYDMVKQKGIGGIGIWALGYDDGYPDLWNLLRDKFSTCEVVPCIDTLYDTGGPNCNHYNNENYTFTIAPDNASTVSLNFTSFQLESGYDSLWIYDGPNTSSPLIGGYSGTTSPGLVHSTGNSLTLQFYSDGATVFSGWNAITGCIADTVNPTTSVLVAGNWQTGDFTAQFTDNDGGGSGLDLLFYQPLEFNGSEWRANDNNGFFNDNFDNTLYPDWVNYSGTWGISSNYLNQNDEANGNSNLYAPLAQTPGEIFLYHWQMNIGGTGANRRAGIHFFSDSAAQPNRGNSYFVYYRVDQDKCQIYKVVNDTWTLETDDAATVDPNVWYDCKVIFNTQTGLIKAYLNDELVSFWTDPTPLSSGNYISPRTGNANVLYNDMKVYHARAGSTVTVTIGPNTTDDIRYQNPNPITPSGRIKSIVKDSAENWSSPAGYDVNIDWTPPSDVIVNDGLSSDIDTVFINYELAANWTTSVDTNSNVVRYWYAIGSSPGDSDIVPWKNNGLNTNVTDSGLLLSNGSTYYYSVQAENGAGLFSNVVSSDGVYIYIASPPVADFSPDAISICQGESVTFNNLSQNAISYQWQFVGGNPSADTSVNPVVQYSMAGLFTVTLVAVNIDGSDTMTGMVTVKEIPSVTIIYNPVINCDTNPDNALTAIAYAGTPPYSYLWSNGQTNATATGFATGNYQVTVTDSLGCFSSISATITIDALYASFAQSADTINLSIEDSVLFTDQSSGSANSWQWDFGNGTYSALQNPVAYYDSVGTYTVSLIVSNGFCSDTAWGEVVVEMSTGFIDIAAGIKISIYPNPNKGKFTIELQNAKCKLKNSKFKLQNAKVTITDILGQKVLQTKIRNPKLQLNLMHLNRGIYFYQIITENVQVHYGKILVE